MWGRVMSELVGVVPNITEDSYELFKALWWAYRNEVCPNYSSLERDTGKTKEELKKMLEPLKKLGFVKTYNGLMTEDGEVAGSGFGITSQQALHLIELALYRYNYNDKPFGSQEDYAPKVLNVAGYTYKLAPAQPNPHKEQQ
jgi:hypothetical protein